MMQNQTPIIFIGSLSVIDKPDRKPTRSVEQLSYLA